MSNVVMSENVTYLLGWLNKVHGILVKFASSGKPKYVLEGYVSELKMVDLFLFYLSSLI